MQFCISLTNPDVFITVLMLKRLSKIKNKSIEDIRNEKSLACSECKHPIEIRVRNDLNPVKINANDVFRCVGDRKPLYEDIFHIETNEYIKKDFYIAHSPLPKDMTLEEEQEARRCFLRINSKNKFFKDLEKHIDSEKFNNVQTNENFGEGLIYYICSSLNEEYNINYKDYIKKNNTNILIDLPTFNRYSDVSSSVKITFIKLEKVKVFFRYFLFTCESSNNFIGIYADILLNNYFGFNAIGKRKRSTLKEKITKHCLTCLYFSFLKLKENKLNELLFMSTWFYNNINKKVRLEELSYFFDLFKDKSSNSLYFMNKIFSCTDRSSLYLPSKKLRDSRFYLDTKEKSRLNGSYLSLTYFDRQDFNFYFIAGYFLVKLISLPYLQSVKVQPT